MPRPDALVVLHDMDVCRRTSIVGNYVQRNRLAVPRIQEMRRAAAAGQTPAGTDEAQADRGAAGRHWHVEPVAAPEAIAHLHRIEGAAVGGGEKTLHVVRRELRGQNGRGALRQDRRDADGAGDDQHRGNRALPPAAGAQRHGLRGQIRQFRTQRFGRRRAFHERRAAVLSEGFARRTLRGDAALAGGAPPQVLLDRRELVRRRLGVDVGCRQAMDLAAAGHANQDPHATTLIRRLRPTRPPPLERSGIRTAGVGRGRCVTSRCLPARRECAQSRRR